MSGSMSRMFKDILEPKVPWTDMIRSEFARKVGAGSYNWRVPDVINIDRDLYSPSRSGFGAGGVVVWGDTSGSISDGEINNYLAELSSIIADVRPKRLTVLWCDTKIHQTDELEDASDLERVRFEGVKGGQGGTDCQPVFDWIKEHMETPDMFIGF